MTFGSIGYAEYERKKERECIPASETTVSMSTTNLVFQGLVISEKPFRGITHVKVNLKGEREIQTLPLLNGSSTMYKKHRIEILSNLKGLRYFCEVLEWNPLRNIF